jgi:hypothetical protein
MANTASYPIIAPKGGDLIVGTQTYTVLDPVIDNPTRNFTVSSLVALAQNGGNVITQKFNANWSKATGAVAPFFNATMQNSFTNTTFTLSRVSVGNYFVTASKPVFTVGKTQCFVTPGTTGAFSPDFFAVIYNSTQSIQVQQIDDANQLSDQLWSDGCINIEVFA